MMIIIEGATRAGAAWGGTRGTSYPPPV